MLVLMRHRRFIIIIIIIIIITITIIQSTSNVRASEHVLTPGVHVPLKSTLVATESHTHTQQLAFPQQLLQHNY